MTFGPTIIYDKSFLQSLTDREAWWFSHCFRTNVPPVLFMEILADLKKATQDEDAAKRRVASLARKISSFNSHINAYYRNVVLEKPDGRPIVGNRPIPVIDGEGKKGVFLEPMLEEEALRKWQDGYFHDFDALLADRWREIQHGVCLETYSKQLKSLLKDIPRFQDLLAVREYVHTKIQEFERNQPYFFFKFLLEYNDVPHQERHLAQWKRQYKKTGNLIMVSPTFPYACYLLEVDFFFHIAISQNLLPTSKKAKANIDLQYIYYLPFCEAFVSKDKFHKNVAPLFMGKKQFYIDGDMLHQDLKRITEHWENLPEDEKSKGSASYAEYPPEFEDSIICALWDKLRPNWRVYKKAPKPKRNPKEDARILAKFKPAMEAMNKLSDKRRTQWPPAEFEDSLKD